MIIPIFLPHGGCPERCAFCDQRVSGGDPTSPAAIAARIEYVLERRPVGPGSVPRSVDVAFYGGTFTDLPRATQERCLAAVQPFLREGRVRAVRLATRPDSNDAQDAAWMTRLRDEFGVRVVELGVQSFSARVLAALGRSQPADAAATTTEALKTLGFEVGWHLMIGCPGEEIDAPDGTMREDKLLLASTLAARPTTVRLHPLVVIAGTALERNWRVGAYKGWQPLGLEEAVVRLSRIVPALESAGIRVIRIGLQANELLGASVVAGPQHPALGDLVRGRILRDQAAEALERARGERGACLAQMMGQIEVPESQLGTLRGPGRANLRWLAAHFGLARVEAQAAPKTALRARLLPMPESSGRVKGLTHVGIGEVGVHHPARIAQRG